MIERKEVENYINSLSIRDRLSLIFSDQSVDWERYGISKSTVNSATNKLVDKDTEIIASVHNVQMLLLDEFIAFCKKNDLKCIAMYGTLLGAVRHGGIIPGDDDIDVALMRDDYNKLMDALRHSEERGFAGGEGDLFSRGIFLQTVWNEDCFYGGYIKLRYTNSTALFPQDWWVDCNQGICIDIFSLDYGYKSTTKEWIKNKKICFLQRLLFAKIYGYFPRFQDMSLLVFKGYKYFGKMFSKKRIADALERTIMLGDEPDYEYKEMPFGVYGHYTKGKGPRKMPIESFKAFETLEYEGRSLYVPEGYDKCLKKLYGKTYMISMQQEFAKLRHGFYAADVPYQNYRERMRDLFKPFPEGKKIVLFGDETFIPYYAEKYGHDVPEVVVYAGIRDVEDERQFIENLKNIEESEELDLGTIYEKACPSQPMRRNQMSLDFPYTYIDNSPSFNDVKTMLAEDFFTSISGFDEYYFIVCSLYIRKTEEKLRSFGVRDYHIFVPNINRDIIRYEDPRYGLLYTNVK